MALQPHPIDNEYPPRLSFILFRNKQPAHRRFDASNCVWGRALSRGSAGSMVESKGIDAFLASGFRSRILGRDDVPGPHECRSKYRGVSIPESCKLTGSGYPAGSRRENTRTRPPGFRYSNASIKKRSIRVNLHATPAGERSKGGNQLKRTPLPGEPTHPNIRGPMPPDRW